MTESNAARQMAKIRSFDEWFDFSGLIFKQAKTKIEKNSMYECRARGYSRYGSYSAADWKDSYDDYAIQYICEDTKSKNVLGCIRLVSSLRGIMETQDYLDISLWPKNGFVPAELSRFAVPCPKRRSQIKFGLWMVAFLNARRSKHTHFVVSTTSKMKPTYDMLGFHSYPGPVRSYSHPRLGGTEHFVIALDLHDTVPMLNSLAAPLYQWTLQQPHPEVILDEE